MSERKDGGPAFPNITPDMNVDGGPGMSLRDYFAIHAPEPDSASVKAAQSYDRSRNPNNDNYKPQLRDEFTIKSQLRYRYADAMLAERDK